MKPLQFRKYSSCPRMTTEQIQILKRRLKCISRDQKVLWIALIVSSMHLGRNRRWVPLSLKIGQVEKIT